MRSSAAVNARSNSSRALAFAALRLAIDAEGKLTILPHVLEKRGLRPGDELVLVDTAEGLLLYRHGVDSLAARWWYRLSEEERGQARAEAHRYQGLGEEERDRIWGEEVESIGEEAEG